MSFARNQAGKPAVRRLWPRQNEAAARLLKISRLRPHIAFVLGSGFQSLTASIGAATEISYAKLPGFPKPRVAGHAGKVMFGHLGDLPVLLLCGRAHYYEGYSMEEITFPIRVLAELGIRAVVLTNAAGGVHPKFRPGDFMYLTDHINLMGANPLRGELMTGKCPFVDLTNIYDRQLNRLFQAAARRAKVRLHGGVYVAVSGPSYETPAEIRAVAKIGGDAIGMSTVPEAIVARQCGLQVAGLSCITNLAAGRNKSSLSHAEVLSTGTQVKTQLSKLLVTFAQLYARTFPPD